MISVEKRYDTTKKNSGTFCNFDSILNVFKYTAKIKGLNKNSDTPKGTLINIYVGDSQNTESYTRTINAHRALLYKMIRIINLFCKEAIDFF